MLLTTLSYTPLAAGGVVEALGGDREHLVVQVGLCEAPGPPLRAITLHAFLHHVSCARRREILLRASSRQLAPATMSVCGIDLGNDTSLVALARKRGIDMILNSESARETPAMAGFTPTRRFVGCAGKGQLNMNIKVRTPPVGQRTAAPSRQSGAPSQCYAQAGQAPDHRAGGSSAWSRQAPPKHPSVTPRAQMGRCGVTGGLARARARGTAAKPAAATTGFWTSKQHLTLPGGTRGGCARCAPPSSPPRGGSP